MDDATDSLPEHGRHDVEQFMHDEVFESLPRSYDRNALIDADRATYVLHQTVSYEYAKPVRDLRTPMTDAPNGTPARWRTIRSGPTMPATPWCSDLV